MKTKLMSMIRKNTNYMCAEQLPDGVETILTIKAFRYETVENPAEKSRDKSSEEKTVCYWEEEGYKPLILNRTNGENIVAATGTKYLEDMIGKRVALYVTPVKAFGEVVDAIRISPKAPAADIVCEDCGQVIKPASGKTAAELAEIGLRNCGRRICLRCMKAEKKRRDEAEAKAKAEAEAKAKAEAEAKAKAEAEQQPEQEPGQDLPEEIELNGLQELMVNKETGTEAETGQGRKTA